MTLSRCYRAECDHPGCDETVVFDTDQARDAKQDLTRIKWLIIRWHTGGVGAGKHLTLCPTHTEWRPEGGGRERPPMFSGRRRSRREEA